MNLIFLRLQLLIIINLIKHLNIRLVFLRLKEKQKNYKKKQTLRNHKNMFKIKITVF